VKSYYASIDRLMLPDLWTLHIKGNSLILRSLHGRILVLAPVRLNPKRKHEPVSDIDTAAVDSLKALDPEWPIREADIV
jgi:hypothetical protein